MASQGIERLGQLAKLIRYYILLSSTEAGSGHPTSSLSAVELMTGLFFGGALRYDISNPGLPNNDRLIFSKGHATPLFYALWAACGDLTEADLRTYRKFNSLLDGHPNIAFRHTEAATGSLGQGLSIGAGMAMNAKYLDKLPYRTYVLLGDSEMAEGSQWEALQLAAHYRLDNLTAIVDINRLGQRGETMYGHEMSVYEERFRAFGWETIVIDGHDLSAVCAALEKSAMVKERPAVILAKTLKGKGISFIEDRAGWHGKALTRADFDRAVTELGTIDYELRGELRKPEDLAPAFVNPQKAEPPYYPAERPVATRQAYGMALKRVAHQFPEVVVLDAEVSNSTYADIFREACPERFFEMYVAEQNMAGAALGLSRRGKIPFVSSFAAFLTRAFDQIRMSGYSDANIKFCGSHAGVSIGEDGPSQMGLEDIAMFRTVQKCVVLYPSDALSTERLVEAAAGHKGIVYIRTTRMALPIVYDAEAQFPIGGCKVLRSCPADLITLVAAGITLHESLAAYEELKAEGIMVRVIDLYSIKPLDAETLSKAVAETGAILTVEDHYPEGGIGEAVRSCLGAAQVCSLAVRRIPKSGSPEELMDFEEISRSAIVKKVKEILK